MCKANAFDRNRRLSAYLSPAGAWALAQGTSMGRGSLVITSTIQLPQAGLNAQLSKPVQPEALFEMLESLIQDD